MEEKEKKLNSNLSIYQMNLRKRKIKYTAIFFICWFVFMVSLVDGILKFQTLVDSFGSQNLKKGIPLGFAA